MNISVFRTTLSEQFKSASNWRVKNTKRYPHDQQRNAEAAKRLLDLESQIHIPHGSWNRIADLVQDDAACLSALSEANRLVGFKKLPADFSSWFESFCTILARQ